MGFHNIFRIVSFNFQITTIAIYDTYMCVRVCVQEKEIQGRN